MNGKRLWIGVVLLASCCWTVQAGMVIYVDGNAPAGGDGTSWAKAYRFLQDGLTSAYAGDEIRVAQGVYKPDQSTAKPEGDRDRAASFELKNGMILKGGYAGLTGADPNAWDNAKYRTILSGDLTGNDVEVVDPMSLFVKNAYPATSSFIIDCMEPTLSENSHHVVTVTGEGTLKGCEVTAGQGADPTIKIPLYTAVPVIVNEFCGAGLYTKGGHVVVEDCMFKGNYSPQYGGGVCVRPGDAKIVRCQFERNLAHFYSGGGIYANHGHIDLNQCDFQNNCSASGGGAEIENSEVNITGCSFIENTVGGGISLYSSTSEHLMYVNNCAFISNRALSGGGGVFTGKGIIDVEGCRFIGNMAVYDGGAILGGQKFNHCVIVGNKAGRAGGAIWTSAGAELAITNCTAYGNWAPSARFIFNSKSGSDGLVRITNSIVRDGGDEIKSGNSILEIRYTDLQGGRESVKDQGGLIWGPGNIDADPCFVNPGYWDPNGTPDDPNDDFFVEGDYHLKSQAGRWDPVGTAWVQDDVTSPCIDTGDPNTLVDYEPLPNGGRINMGFYGGTLEASKSLVKEPAVPWSQRLQQLLTSIKGTSSRPPTTAIEGGYLHILSAWGQSYFPVPGTDPNQPVEVAKEFLRQWLDLFMQKSVAVGFTLLRADPMSYGTIVRLQQTYAGLEVFTGQVIVQLNTTGGVAYVTSGIMVNPTALDNRPDLMKPSVSSTEAQEIGKAFMAGSSKGDACIASEPTLLIFDPGVLRRSGDPCLAWILKVTPVRGICGWTLYINAHSGEVLLQIPLCLN